jgi:iron(III) transport system substrate-binding protein
MRHSPEGRKNRRPRRSNARGILALAASLLGAVVGSGAAMAQSREVIEAAQKEGEVVWYSSQLNDDAGYDAVRKAFTAKYPGMKLSVVSGASGSVYQRLTQDLRMGAPHADVLSTATVGQFIELKKQGMLERYAPKNMSKVASIFQSYGDDDYYHATIFTLMGIAYNTNKVSANDVPMRWSDLLDPKWQGKLAMGHPGFSGTVAEWAAAMVKLYGWEYFETLSKRAPLVGRSVLDGITMVVSGERIVTPTLISAALASAAQGNPIKVAYPEDGVVLVAQPSAILKNAPHPNAARLLIEFLLDKEFGPIAAQGGMSSTLVDAPLVPGSKSISELKLLVLKPQESLDGTALVISKWQATFGQ